MGRVCKSSGLAAVLLASSLAPVLTGCAAHDAPVAEDATTRFYAALRGGDGAAACSLLSPAARQDVEQTSGAPCSRGVLQEDLPRPGPPRAASVYGDQAQVQLRGDTVFLARFRQGWKVVAAGCTPRAERPYDCEVEAG
jgi:hypothetical protein